MWRTSDRPETASLGVVYERIAGAIKLLEDSRLLVTLDADAAIANLQFEHTLLAIKPHAQKFFVVGIFQCIVDQIDKRPRDGFAIDAHCGNAGIDLLFERESLLLDLVTIGVERVAHEFGDISLAKVVFFARRLRCARSRECC